MKRSRRSRERRKAALERSLRRSQQRVSRQQVQAPTEPVEEVLPPLPPPEPVDIQPILPLSDSTDTTQKIWLFTQYYQVSNPVGTPFSEEEMLSRQAEIDLCLEKNLQDPRFEAVVTVQDQVYDTQPGKGNPKLKVVNLKKRPRFLDFFELINSMCGPGDLALIANSDIYFDETLSALYNLNLNGRALALTRWDPDESGVLVHYGEKTSQDVWVFPVPLAKRLTQKGPRKHSRTPGDFFLGIPGCDNRIAFEIRNAGYKVSNPSHSIRAIHAHEVPLRTYLHLKAKRGKRVSVRGPYLFLEADGGENIPLKRTSKPLKPRGTEMESVSTLVTNELADEFLILAKSLELAGNPPPLFVLTDTPTAELIEAEFPNMDIRVSVVLDDYSNRNRQNMVDDAVWNEFMLKKTEVIRLALSEFGNTLFVDSDLVFFNPIHHINLDQADVALSPHHIVRKDEVKFGRYNAGYLAVKNEKFLDWWIKATYDHSKYFEQECLNRAAKSYTVAEIPIQHNFGWWRVNQSGEKAKRMSLFSTDRKGLYYDKKPLVSVHTHIVSKKPVFEVYNQFILGHLRNSGLARHRALYTYIQNKRR